MGFGAGMDGHFLVIASNRECWEHSESGTPLSAMDMRGSFWNDSWERSFLGAEGCTLGGKSCVVAK